jgi:hypothetical protein
VRINGCGNCGVSATIEDHNFLRKLVVGTSLSLSILLLLLLSETSEHVSAYNLHKILPSCRTFLRKAIIAAEGKQREYLNEWYLCCSRKVLKVGGQDLSV